MLFLAVFCGFLAEYQLEHKIEKDRIKKYMKDMIADLRSDTAFINGQLDYTKQTVDILDSFIQNLYSESSFQNTSVLYTQYSRYLRLLTPIFNDQTITQLRSAGNLRLIDNEEITNQLAGYWFGINAVTKIAERIEQRYDVAGEMALRIFNRKYFYTYSPGDSLRNYQFIESGNAEPMLLMTKDKNDLIAFANIVDRIKGSVEIYREGVAIHEQRAIALMALIKQEYHFN
jgi:hypothetical protein